MAFPYEKYATFTRPVKTFYPAGQEELARQLAQEVDQASQLLEQLLHQPTPELAILLVAAADWSAVPLDDVEAPDAPTTMLPYWTDVTTPPTLVVPERMDEIIGEASPEKRSLLLYHELAHAFFEADPRPWPADSPLWADEWPLQFAAFWLFHRLHGQIDQITADLHEQFAASFEPEADGKTPVTVRGFDWYEDTSPEDYLEFALLLENFATDLLAHYDETILPRFLERYRHETPLLSEDVTRILAEVLGEGGAEWLEALVYF